MPGGRPWLLGSVDLTRRLSGRRLAGPLKPVVGLHKAPHDLTEHLGPVDMGLVATHLARVVDRSIWRSLADRDLHGQTLSRGAPPSLARRAPESIRGRSPRPREERRDRWRSACRRRRLLFGGRRMWA